MSYSTDERLVGAASDAAADSAADAAASAAAAAAANVQHRQMRLTPGLTDTSFAVDDIDCQKATFSMYVAATGISIGAAIVNPSDNSVIGVAVAPGAVPIVINAIGPLR